MSIHHLLRRPRLHYHCRLWSSFSSVDGYDDECCQVESRMLMAMHLLGVHSHEPTSTRLLDVPMSPMQEEKGCFTKFRRNLLLSCPHSEQSWHSSPQSAAAAVHGKKAQHSNRQLCKPACHMEEKENQHMGTHKPLNQGSR